MSILRKKYEEDSKLGKFFDKFSKLFTMKNLREAQGKLFNLLRSFDQGAIILSEIAKNNAKAGEKLKQIFNYSTQNLKAELSRLDLNKAEISDILRSYERGILNDYARMEKVLNSIYKNEKIKLDPRVYENLKIKLMEENLKGAEIDEFLKELKNSLFSQELNFKQLNNAKKFLNSMFNQSQNYGSYLKGLLSNQLKKTL
ncbi:hypothetical protein LNT47_02905 [Campylobacter sp. VicNov18]|uniref:hypothetical protein n=1 Tax=Campylobacter bilis TaxID=2691918 RepID=UPI00130E44E4|nr:hypothetical protein [Campylobacter bilis]MPV63368.1 hypothetical protein [Campylobacter hepaticus]MBM0636867.1 hypothetical protein [Campylobacter bilis]MCC8277573.1 hypothetical protein [Campylobacter bilis]MCC8299182.1 hypothetical protein [Campylobacter bilis]MCC8300482.1 hypothetical protein [Campylobacter bilis]